MNDSINALNLLIHSLISLELLPATTPKQLWEMIKSEKEQIQNVCKYESDGNPIDYSRITVSSTSCTSGDANSSSQDSH